MILTKRKRLIFAACVFVAATCSAKLPTISNEPKAPIPVPFTIKEAGYVTLVIENSAGFRVRNLISETWFPAGADTAWWDGLDDLGRDIDASDHGVYHIPSRFVNPGEYRVRGLVRGEITPKYEFSPYTTGNPPWSTADHTGAWLANHTPPMSALFVPANQSPTGQPAVFLGCYVTEGPDGLAWVDLDGKNLAVKNGLAVTGLLRPIWPGMPGEMAFPATTLMLLRYGKPGSSREYWSYVLPH